MTDENEQVEAEAKASNPIDGLKQKNRELIQSNKDLKQQLADLQSSLDDLRNGLEETKAKKEGDIEKIIASKDSKFAKERDTWSAREKSLMAALEANLVDAAATQAIASQDGIPKLLLPHVKRRMKVAEADGKYVVQIMDEDGLPTQMSVTDLIAEYRADADFAGAFKVSNVAAGTGTRTSTTLSGEVNPYARATRDLTAQGRLEATNPAKAAALRAAAEAETNAAKAKPALRPLKSR